MVPAALVSVEEYLSTDYSPDCDYVDGVLEDRNVGRKKHAVVQKKILLFFASLEERYGIFVIQEQRVQIGPARYRVPDICVMLGGDPGEEIFRTPPFLCVEVVSPDDRMGRMQVRIKDYLDMGVQCVWVVDPYTRLAWTYTRERAVEAKDDVLRTPNPDIEMPLSEILG